MTCVFISSYRIRLAYNKKRSSHGWAVERGTFCDPAGRTPPSSRTDKRLGPPPVSSIGTFLDKTRDATMAWNFPLPAEFYSQSLTRYEYHLDSDIVLTVPLGHSQTSQRTIPWHTDFQMNPPLPMQHRHQGIKSLPARYTTTGFQMNVSPVQ